MTKEEQQQAIVAFARTLIGVPYRYGVSYDEAPKVFDCSGFTKYLFAHIGIDIPRSTIEQAEFVGEKMEPDSALEPGDLLFFRGERGHYSPETPEGVGHVAVYVGDDRVISAWARRVGHWPDPIREVGEVKEEPLAQVTARSGPVVAVKRLIGGDA